MYNLKTYLRNVYELEASVYQQENGIKSIENKLVHLPQKPVESSASSSLVMGIIGLALGVAAAIWGLNLIASNEPFVPILGLLVIAGSGFLLFWSGVGSILGLSETNSSRKSYKNGLTRYENSLILKNALNSELPALRNKLSETQSLLRSYYAKGVLHPKYQNFVAEAYLLDCIETGRHTKLDGPDGAYNQYELEVRMDRISSQLDTVIDKLDQIRQNQYSLYAAITQANRTNELMFQKLDGYCRNLDNLNASTDQIRRSLDTANHTAELTRKEIAYRNYLDRGTSYSY